MKPINFNTAEIVVRNLRRNGVRSNSMLVQRCNNLKDKSVMTPEFIKNMKEVIYNRLGEDITEFRYQDFRSYVHYLRELKRWFKKTKVANCREMADLACLELALKKISVSPVEANLKDIISGEIIPYTDHCFALINLAPKARIENPKTWGKDAVIVDAWAGMVKRAQEGLNFIKNEIYQIKENQKVVFEEY